MPAIITLAPEHRTKAFLEFSRLWFSRSLSKEQQDHFFSHFSQFDFQPTSLHTTRDDLMMAYCYLYVQTGAHRKHKDWPETTIILGQFAV